ncbi:PQQ-binding-like beta-propeller repeat protein [Streptomyces prunicolor]|uniref:outer membrane protein assembly factor BamB family protein n=1 Tax=Streptomyces prunicolor TaxID=67348 RepID=UPI00386896AA|nr:PQQ-binding-like beta-propeller repeat protein [Streptomyces prunicolor]
MAAVLALLATGTVLMLRDDDSTRSDGRTSATSPTPTPTPTTINGREFLNVDPPKPKSDSDYIQTPGAWLTSRVYATGAEQAVTGYNLTTGKRAWTVPLSGGLCGASRNVTSAGLVAVVFQTEDTVKGRCTRFAVIDVNKGVKVWEKPITDESVSLGLGLNVAISDTVAAAGWPDGSAAYDTSTGAPAWTAPADGCTQEEHLGGAELLTLSYCKTSAGMKFRVGERDPGTGKATWRYEVPKARGAWLVSSEPLVLGLLQNDDGLDADQLVTVSDEGKVQSTIPLGDDYVAGCGETGGCGATVVSGDTAYLGSDPHNYSAGNRITAFDLTTGKAIRSFPAPDDSTLVPVRAEGKALVAAQEAEPTTPARVLRLDPATGKSTTLMEMPNELSLNSTLHSLISTDVKEPMLYDDGRFFLHTGSGYLMGETSPDPMTLAFTTW